MCLSTPDIPTTPERQDARNASRLPGAGPDDAMKRRRGYAAAMRTTSTVGGADLAPAATTANVGKQKLGV